MTVSFGQSGSSQRLERCPMRTRLWLTSSLLTTKTPGLGTWVGLERWGEVSPVHQPAMRFSSCRQDFVRRHVTGDSHEEVGRMPDAWRCHDLSSSTVIDWIEASVAGRSST